MNATAQNAGRYGLRLSAALACAVITLGLAPVATAQARNAAAPNERVPDQSKIKAAVDAAYAAVKTNQDGKNADYIPALAQVSSDLFGIAVVTVDGKVYAVGDDEVKFVIESVSKPFTASWLIENKGAQWVEQKIGVNQTGLPFNSVIAIETHANTTPAMNPLVNAGSITTASWIEPADPEQRWKTIIELIQAYAGHALTINETVYRSESSNYEHNRAISRLLKGYGVLNGDPQVALDLYTRQCSIELTVKDLAVMGATLANGGENPITHKRVVSSNTAEKTMAVMSTTGLYETTGAWIWNVGLPAKSGVGGGIVAVVPGKFAIATFAPPLDGAGNSVKGQKAIGMIVHDLIGSGVFETGK